MGQLFHRPNGGSHGRLVGRPHTPRDEQPAGPNDLDGPVDATDRTGLLGEPFRGDERSALGSAAPGMTVADDYDAVPSARRIGEGLVADGINFQSRPSASMWPGEGTEPADAGEGSGGGSGQ